MTQDNPLQGIKRLKIKGKTYTLQFTWDEISEVEKLFENPAAMLGDLDSLLIVAAVGMRIHHPDMTPESLRALHPPIFPLQAACSAALRFAYWGDEDPDAVAAEAAGDADGAKKKPRLLKKFLRWLSERALPPQNSGDSLPT